MRLLNFWSRSKTSQTFLTWLSSSKFCELGTLGQYLILTTFLSCRSNNTWLWPIVRQILREHLTLKYSQPKKEKQLGGGTVSELRENWYSVSARCQWRTSTWAVRAGARRSVLGEARRSTSSRRESNWNRCQLATFSSRARNWGWLMELVRMLIFHGHC